MSKNNLCKLEKIINLQLTPRVRNNKFKDVYSSNNLMKNKTKNYDN